MSWYQPEHYGPSLDSWKKIWINANLGSKTSGNERMENAAAIYNLDSNRQLIALFSGTPWRSLRDHYSQGIDGLHEEIQDFCRYMSPKPIERMLREAIITEMRLIVTRIWSFAKLFPYGSFRSGLYLPTSDIDMTIIQRRYPISFKQFKTELLINNVAIPESIIIIEKANVPIIRFTHSATKYRINITFNVVNAVKSAQIIKAYIAQYPNITQLIYVIKYFLLQRNLHQVFNGGISSYCVSLMVISFFQLHPRPEAQYPNANLGQLLIEFFELYGKNFNYLKVGVKITNGGRYFPKFEIREIMGKNYIPSEFYIEDPAEQRNDVCVGTFGIMTVRKAFEYGYFTLINGIGQLSAIIDPNESILGRIIRITDKIISNRDFTVKSNIAKYQSELQYYYSIADTLEKRKFFNDEHDDAITNRNRSNSMPSNGIRQKYFSSMNRWMHK